MLRMILGMLLAIPLSTQALEVSIDLGSSLKHFDDAYGELNTGPERMGLTMHFAESWFAGIEGLYRRGNIDVPIVNYFNPGTFNARYQKETRVKSLGLQLGYGYRFASHHRASLGLAGGLNRYQKPNPDVPGSIKENGDYYAASAFYDYLLGDHFSIGLSWREQWDRVDLRPPLKTLHSRAPMRLNESPGPQSLLFF